ncbi:MAG TPA: hypothetical protein VNY32_00195, partial [Candidatus Acidoferrales bacterium]|nr:hypothetical protein [Candidatus Acidoferrales bacterium]
ELVGRRRLCAQRAQGPLHVLERLTEAARRRLSSCPAIFQITSHSNRETAPGPIRGGFPKPGAAVRGGGDAPAVSQPPLRKVGDRFQTFRLSPIFHIADPLC